MSKKLFTRVVPVMVVAAALSMVMLAGCSMQDEADDTQSGVVEEETIVEDVPGSSGEDATKVMTEDEVKALAFKDANVVATDATNVKVLMKTENGVDVYDVSFDAKGYHYAYTINAKTGDVIDHEKTEATSSSSAASSDSKDSKSSSSN